MLLSACCGCAHLFSLSFFLVLLSRVAFLCVWMCQKSLQSRLDSISADPNFQSRAVAGKDFLPTPLVLSLHKLYPVSLKAGEPMGVNLQDVANIKSLVQELFGTMNAVVTKKRAD